MRDAPKRGAPHRLSLRSLAGWLLRAAVLLWLSAALTLAAMRWVDPPTTAVQIERRIQATLAGKPYTRRYQFVPLQRIAPDLQHAVIAAEDARFYQHHGFDWQAMEIAAEGDMHGRRLRGGSTLTQQLVKNLLLGAERSYLRKGVEATLVPIAELVLGKRRILELYLNVVEWGPGVYGAEAASRYHFHTSARRLSRTQAAELAAILPAPRRRRPERMARYSAIIQQRMRQMGW